MLKLVNENQMSVSEWLKRFNLNWSVSKRPLDRWEVQAAKWLDNNPTIKRVVEMKGE